ncbi:hypothetical protein GYMLUDRAFT_779227 [Collybiopsis luxurians FD-317 M1]|uniref:Uncharacterized protein n=1 Tax=Collybiopsis luxurians FD-317 M1 TaxID=944289 RepID=A0A0D0C2T0_9AGAR|nr:hypothetical protein GYMLUDRAFT_779227 [Collybiopsis luxurians FD-317 M1]
MVPRHSRFLYLAFAITMFQTLIPSVFALSIPSEIILESFDSKSDPFLLPPQLAMVSASDDEKASGRLMFLAQLPEGRDAVPGHPSAPAPYGTACLNSQLSEPSRTSVIIVPDRLEA